MTSADHDRDDSIARMRRIIEENTEPAPYGPQYEALHALIAEELARWLNFPGGRTGIPDPDEIYQIAGIIAWEIEAAFPVGPERTPAEWWQVFRDRQAAELEKGSSSG